MNQSAEPTDVARAPGAPERTSLNAIPAQPAHRPARPSGPGEPSGPEERSGPACRSGAVGPPAGAGSRQAPAPGAAEAPARARTAARGVLRLLPGPKRTPFTFAYTLVLALTSLVTQYADPGLVSSLLHGSSTDVAHLTHSPALVLVASALWIAGGITSPYAIGFLLVLTALERRIGGLRTAGVFLLGHVVATLATEVPVGLSVLAGHLPDSSLHRLDYGISFGVAASVGALAGLLPSWARWTVLAGFGWVLVDDLIAFADPMTNWGHLLALAIGVATWPLLRRARYAATASTTEGNAAVGSTRVSLSPAAASSAANSSRVRS
ncbi:rhomboid-like protein [Streptomyces flavofungini]|uniref:rhomboid-like protein n=1 Tax=Streptomyces flavofungini TaxID=68200 RepID=UPI0034DF8C2F